MTFDFCRLYAGLSKKTCETIWVLTPTLETGFSFADTVYAREAASRAGRATLRMIETGRREKRMRRGGGREEREREKR